MSETLNIETEDVYETPLLAEAGDFADLTQGGTDRRDPEGNGTFFNDDPF